MELEEEILNEQETRYQFENNVYLLFVHLESESPKLGILQNLTFVNLYNFLEDSKDYIIVNTGDFRKWNLEHESTLISWYTYFKPFCVSFNGYRRFIYLNSFVE